MIPQFKNNFRGHFQFYYSIIGGKIFLFILLNIFIALLDGLGLSMFIPLIQIALNKTAFNPHSFGNLQFITSVPQNLGIELNLVNVLFILIVIFIVKGLMNYIQIYFLARIRLTLILYVRNNILDLLKHISYKGFLSTDSGRIQNSMLSEVARLYASMKGYFDAIQSGVMLIIYCAIALFTDYRFTLIVIAISILISFLYKKIFSKTQTVSINFSKKGDQFNSHLVQVINHFKYLKATNTYGKYLKKLKKIVWQAEMLNMKLAKYHAISEGIREPIAVAIICGIVYIQYRFFASTNISLIMVCLLLFYRSLSQLGVLQTSWQMFVQNIGSMHSIATLTNEMESMREDNIGGKRVDINQIDVQNVGLQYDDFIIFKHININIKKNTTIAFVGESGSGKTSLANIIIGLIQPTSGDILVSGQPMSEIDLSDYRNKIGYISQESVVFNDTIFNNVTFFDEPNTENYERFWHVINLAFLNEFTQSLPKKEQSILGDNGILISGGQRQRISIARELYKRCKLLIFDEATSSLDSETEIAIKENIEQLKGKYTIIIIAHRLSTIKNADIIYFFKDKTIVEKGSFNELMETSDNFRKMVHIQAF